MPARLRSFAREFSLPLPPAGEGWGEGRRRLIEALRLLMVFCSFLEGGGRELPPAGHLLFFASPKKRRQKKGDPACRVPTLRFGQPAVLGQGAVRQNSLRSLRSLRSNSCRKLVHEAGASCSALARPLPCAPRHGQRGGGTDSGHCCARPSVHLSFPYWGKINSRPAKGWAQTYGIPS